MLIRKCLLLGILIFTSIIAGRNEDPCECMDISKDDFGSTKKEITVTGGIAKRFPYSIGIKKQDAKCNAEIIFGSYGEVNTLIEAGATVYIALFDGSKIELQNPIAVPPVTNLYKSSIITTWNLNFELNANHLKEILKSPVKAIKISLAGKDIIHSFSEKNGNKIKNAAQCLLKDYHSANTH